MAKKNLESCRKGKDFIGYAVKQGATVVEGKGCHAKVIMKKGVCIVPRHNKDIGKGLRRVIVKTFVAIGLACIPAMLIMALFP